MIDEALEIIEDYLNGESDTDDFKTDIAVLVDMDYSDRKEENEVAADLIASDLLDILNDHEDGSCLMSFMEKVNDVYERIKEVL